MARDKLLTTVSLRPSGDQETQVRESSPEWETLVSRRPEATSHSHTCQGHCLFVLLGSHSNTIP